MTILRLAFEIGSPRNLAAELTMLASGFPESHCGCFWDGLAEGTLFTSLYESGPSFQTELNLHDVTKWFCVDTRLQVGPADIERAKQTAASGWKYDLAAAVASGFRKRLLDPTKRFCSQVTKEFARSLAGGQDAFPGHVSFNPGELAMQATGKMAAAADFNVIADRRDALRDRLAECWENSLLSAEQVADINRAVAF